MEFRTFKREEAPRVLRHVDRVLTDLQTRSTNRFERLFLDILRSYSLRESTRPALLVVLGYRALDSGEEEEARKVAAALHLLHTYFHIQDDVVDRDEVRGDYPTLWKQVEDRLSAFGVYDPHHINAMGFIGGNVARIASLEAVLDTDLPRKTKEALVSEILDLDLHANFGEFTELVQTALNPQTLSEKDIMDVYQKLTRYWVYGALKLGSIVAGEDDVYRDFAVPLGVAAQLLNDLEDILSGRLSDIRERRVTFFVWFLYNHGEEKDIGRVEKLMGKTRLTQREKELLQKIFTRSGAIEYVRVKAKDLLEEAQIALSTLNIKEEFRPAFQDLLLTIEGKLQ